MTEPICASYVNAVRLLGKRWTPLIVHVLLSGPQRFGAIAAAISVLSDRVLAERLRELEAAGVVERRIEPQGATRVEYALTAKGRDLEVVVRELHRWAHRWDQDEEASQQGADRGEGGQAGDRGRLVVRG